MGLLLTSLQVPAPALTMHFQMPISRLLYAMVFVQTWHASCSGWKVDMIQMANYPYPLRGWQPHNHVASFWSTPVQACNFWRRVLLRHQKTSMTYRAALTDLFRLGPDRYAECIGAVDAALPAIWSSAVSQKR